MVFLRRHRAVFLFLFLTLLDLTAWRALLIRWRPLENRVSKAAFVIGDDGKATALAIPWVYPMFPQPTLLDPDTLTIPPGYPVMFEVGAETALHVDLYERRAPPLVLVRAKGTLPFAVLRPPSVLEPLTEPPSITSLQAFLECFPNDATSLTLEGRANSVVITAGTCSWTLEAATAEVVLDSPGASVQVKRRAGPPLADWSPRWWLIVLVLLGSILHRLPLRDPRWMVTDAAGILVVLWASTRTPLWVVLWCFKGCVGGAILAGELALGALRRWHPVVNAGAVVALLVAAVLGPDALVRLNTRFNELTTPGSMAVESTSPAANTTTLVVGYSTVNGAALHLGSYGSGALDALLQRECGNGEVFGRHAVDGQLHCASLPAWHATASTLPSLKKRVFLGGFNDDFTAPATLLGHWIGMLVALVPGPYPPHLEIWSRGAVLNRASPRREEMLRCVSEMARGAPLLHVNDLATFDFGHPRLFDREAWIPERRAAVEASGGTFIDGRDLLPAESPMFYNDMVHPSEVGYALMVKRLCPLIRP